MNKEQFVSLIEASFNTGQENFISGNMVYNAFLQLCDMVFGMNGTGRYRGVATVNTSPGTPQYGDFYFAAFNQVNQQVFGNFSLTVEAGELCVFRFTSTWSKQIIGTITGDGSSGSMTAQEIRDALQTLSGFDRLQKAAILHSEASLNFLGFDNFSSMAYTSNVYKGDFFINTQNGAFQIGDWAIALEDAIDTEEIGTSSDWLILNFGSFLKPSNLKDGAESLSGLNRIEKSAIRGADFALNYRGSGDVLSSGFTTGISNLTRGDFFIYKQANPAPPAEGDIIAHGDWVVSLQKQDGPFYIWDFTNQTYWMIIHFGDVNIVSTDIKTYRKVNDTEGIYFTIPDIHANIISMTINKLTYHGKLKDSKGFESMDYVFEVVGDDTRITINDDLLGFHFFNGVVVDILYKDM